jgi:hypothetical protein
MQSFTWSATKKLLAERGVELLSAGLDEVPDVYKDIHTVMAAQSDLVEVLGQFDPKLVKMCPAGERAEDSIPSTIYPSRSVESTASVLLSQITRLLRKISRTVGTNPEFWQLSYKKNAQSASPSIFLLRRGQLFSMNPSRIK